MMSGRSGFLWRSDKEVERAEKGSLVELFSMLKIEVGQRVVGSNSPANKTRQMLTLRWLLLFGKKKILHFIIYPLNPSNVLLLCIFELYIAFATAEKTNANQATNSCSGAKKKEKKVQLLPCSHC